MSKKKVLVFDDDKDILEICRIILEEAGYEIDTSDNARDIEKKVSKFMPDLILMDNWLPDLGGIVATQTIKNNRKFKQIPVIYFSANTDIAILATQAGADGYLAKPFDITELEEIVKKHLI